MTDFNTVAELLGDEIELQYAYIVNKEDFDRISVSTSTSFLNTDEKGEKTETNLTILFVIILSVALLILAFDMKGKINSDSVENLIEIQECTRLFTINRCLDKVPLTEKMCLEWEKCMAKESNNYSILQIFSSLLALVIKSFFENLQINSFGILLLSGVFGVYLFKKLK